MKEGGNLIIGAAFYIANAMVDPPLIPTCISNGNKYSKS